MTLSTQNLNYLRFCDQRIGSVQRRVTTPEMVMANTTIAGFKGEEFTQAQADSEIKRLTAARKNIVSGLSKEERKEYKDWQKESGPKEMTAAERAAVVARLDANKDKPSH